MYRERKSEIGKYGTAGYGRYLLKLEKKLGQLPLKKGIRAVGYQGRKSRWIGVKEFSQNHINDKRSYYRKIYLKSRHWFYLKRIKLKEVKFCEKCGSSKHLDVHHKDYKNLYDVLLSDLTVLCRKCHYEEHKSAQVVFNSSINGSNP